MLSQVLSFGLLVNVALGSEFFSPTDNFGAMFPRADLGKRQGYYPGTKTCGKGNTCAEACGPTQVQCPSKSGIYCFDPAVGQQCCPDMTGNSCRAGYYCTTDGRGTTYCCPDGMDTQACAASYSLTVSLIRATGSVSIPSASGLASTTPIHISSTPGAPIFPTATYSLPLVPTGNATYTTSPPIQYTGAAQKVAAGGVAVLAGAAGLVGLL
ncbi:hypothetical protein B0J11DRAFT_311333 [Dendryphion nanum]|uniref:Uncharacterized protein n=1 Tax=Dendryphion nanum TaxID=256645 RepID=A0A9P9IM81_9PLEO|nr:hypothetical protein B0J11DRAFT_311333 [Dendryphion nanum]